MIKLAWGTATVAGGIASAAPSIHTETMDGSAQRTHELLERVNAARVRFMEAVAVERQLFDQRFDGLAESFRRWTAQNQRVIEALKEYDAATTDYLAAIARK